MSYCEEEEEEDFNRKQTHNQLRCLILTHTLYQPPKSSYLIKTLLIVIHSQSHSTCRITPVDMLISQYVTELEIENHVFPPAIKPPGSSKTMLLGGAGVRGLVIGGSLVKFTVIGVYLEDTAISSLATKWKGKGVVELANSVDFFNDVIGGSFEKFTRVTMILPLHGKQYAEKVAENCVSYLKEVGLYTEAESKAIEDFLEVFKNQNFAPGESVFFTHSSLGSMHVGFSKDSLVPEEDNVVIANKHVSEAVLESIIGKNGVSPQAKRSLAERLCDLFGKYVEDVTSGSEAKPVITGADVQILNS